MSSSVQGEYLVPGLSLKDINFWGSPPFPAGLYFQAVQILNIELRRLSFRPILSLKSDRFRAKQ